ncbi:unnamed protein product, partial [marine sediment metagenome]
GIISNCSGFFNATDGIELDNCEDFIVTDCFASCNGEYGIKITDCTDVDVIDSIFKNNNCDTSTAAIRHGNSSDIRYINCRAFDSRIVTGTDISFEENAGAADTIEQVAEQFILNGFIAGEDVTVAGTDSNDGAYTIVSLTAAVLTLSDGDLTTEAAGDDVTITHDKVQQFGMVTMATSDSISLVNCDFSGNLTGNISNGASATITSASIEAEDWRMGDGLWTNYVEVTAAGVMTMAGSATIDGVGAGNLVDKSATEAITGTWEFETLVKKVITITDGDATPDISGGGVFVTSSNTGATEITDLDSPTVGQIVTIIIGNATNPSTIADGGNFALSAAWNPDLDDVIVLFVQA